LPLVNKLLCTTFEKSTWYTKITLCTEVIAGKEKSSMLPEQIFAEMSPFREEHVTSAWNVT